MKTVAIIAPDFCPSSVPALVIPIFTDHLREFGWNPVVVVRAPVGWHRYSALVVFSNELNSRKLTSSLRNSL